MELIQIIYSILVYGLALLLLVILISFVTFRLRGDERGITENLTYTYFSGNKKLPVFQHNQAKKYNNLAQKNYAVLPIQFRMNRELNILRKPTVEKKELREQIRREEKSQGKTDGRGKRYFILNEEMKKNTKNKAINF